MVAISTSPTMTAHRSSLPAPPPVFLRSSPPQLPSKRPMSCTISRKPLPSGVQIENVHGSISDVGMSWKPVQTQDPPQKDVNGPWSMVNAQTKAGDGSSRGSLDSITMVDHHSRSPFRSPVDSQSNLHLQVPSRPRTHSVYSYGSDRSQPSPRIHARSSSASDTRPFSWIDLLHSSYPQPGPAIQLSNAHLQSAVGNKASLLSHKQTFDMYLANVKKTDDPAVQYEFALFLLTKSMQDQPVVGPDSAEMTQASLLKEAKVILQRLADRSYPFAQYYLGDGYASGLFSKDTEDYDRAFPLFVAASKHGHVEACYRAALCYEFGWGTRVEAARAAQFYRQAASKNHPGAMLRMAQACLAGDMGLGRKRYREGVKWMKRATESSDTQYNSAPYELGLLHETGYGDDVFPDASYAAQLFTRSAELGHAEASYRLGDAYEHGLLHCPRDPGLSIHFYTGAAQQGHPLAMMALCAWYMVGAEPVLERDENEAYEWAKRAADLGMEYNPLIIPIYLYYRGLSMLTHAELPKAQYAVGYFTEMGLGCQQEPSGATEWYVRAADQGDVRAKQRLATIHAAANGGSSEVTAGNLKSGNKSNERRSRWFGIF